MPVSRNRRGRGGRRVPRAIEPVRPRSNRPGWRRRFYLLASIVIAVLVIASFAFASFTGGGGVQETVTLGSAFSYVDGVGVQAEIMPTRNHRDGEILEYNTVPATSGDHWNMTQTCGFHDFEVPDEVVVHNLEHSNVVISYNLATEEQIDDLQDVFDDLGAEGEQFGVARRYSKIAPGQVALSAWGIYDVMQGVDKDRIERFFDHYVGRLGPEGAIPCAGPQPSMPQS